MYREEIMKEYTGSFLHFIMQLFKAFFAVFRYHRYYRTNNVRLL